MSTMIATILLLLTATATTKTVVSHLTTPYLSPATISANYHSMVKTFKIFIYKPNNSSSSSSSSSSSFTFHSPLHSLFYTSLLDSDIATNISDHAHLFFLPFPPDLPTRSLERLIRTIRTDFPFWNRTLGADHFYLSSCSAGGLAGYDSSDRGLVELKKNSIQISCFPTPPGGHLIPHKDITLPPLASPHAPTTNSTTLLGYVRKNWINDPGILTELRAHPEFLVEDSEPSKPRIYAERLSSSKFCIFEYGGGDVSGIGEALRFGCVPVVITDCPIQDLPFMDVLRWQEMALFVGRGGAKELKSVLVRACWERHEQMRRLGIVAGKHLVWNVPPRTLDAFHTMLYQLWLRRHTIRYGRWETA